MTSSGSTARGEFRGRASRHNLTGQEHSDASHTDGHHGRRGGPRRLHQDRDRQGLLGRARPVDAHGRPAPLTPDLRSRTRLRAASIRHLAAYGPSGSGPRRDTIPPLARPEPDGVALRVDGGARPSRSTPMHSTGRSTTTATTPVSRQMPSSSCPTETGLRSNKARLKPRDRGPRSRRSPPHRSQGREAAPRSRRHHGYRLCPDTQGRSAAGPRGYSFALSTEEERRCADA